LRERHRLRVFENRVLGRIFGPKRDEVTEEWRKLHKREHHNLYLFPNIIRHIKSRRMWWARHVDTWERENCTRFWWEHERKELLGRLRHRWVVGSKWTLGRLAGRVWSVFT
jgi:hypothetical protein